MSVCSRDVVLYLYKSSENAFERAGWRMDDMSSSGRRHCFKEIKSSGSSTHPPWKYFKKPDSHLQYIFISLKHVKMRISISKLWIKIFRSRVSLCKLKHLNGVFTGAYYDTSSTRGCILSNLNCRMDLIHSSSTNEKKIDLFFL